VLAVCALGAFMAFLDATIVNVAFPSLQGSFADVSRSWLAWVLNGYNIVFAALLVPAGRLADRYGRRSVFLAGLAVFTGASAACALAPSVETLVAFRAVQAVGAALMVPTSLGLLLGELPASRRVAGVAMLAASAAVAAAVGPSLGGLLVDASSWRLVFVVNLPLGLVGIAAGYRLLREQRDTARMYPSSVVAVGVLAAGVCLVALGLSQGPQWGWGDARVLASFGAAAALLAMLALRARRRPSTFGDLTLQIPSVRVANVAVLVFAGAFYAKILIDVLFLTSVWHYSVLTAGAAITPGPLITAALARPAGRLATRVGLGTAAVAGGLAYALGCLWYALFTSTHPHYVSRWLPGTVLTGIGIAMAFTALTSAAVESLPARLYATGSAVNATARQLGGALGIAIAIAIVGMPAPGSAHSAFVGAWVYAAAAATVAAAVAAWLVRMAPQLADRSSEGS
jgi:EmrB/QacA subfamily drug resistance transporter